MKATLAVVTLGLCLLAGCLVTVRFYPVQGPLSRQSRVPVFSAKIDGLGEWRNITVILANDENFTGTFSVSSPREKIKDATAGAVPTPNLSAAWDTVYGKGFYVSHVLRAKELGRAHITGNQGSVLDMEIFRRAYAGGGEPNSPTMIDLKGVAKDSNGNIYKIAF